MIKINKQNIKEYLSKSKLYRRKGLTSAVRMDGPFIIENSEVNEFCSDGWLVTDKKREYLYTMADKEFQLVYEEEMGSEQSMPLIKSPSKKALKENKINTRTENIIKMREK